MSANPYLRPKPQFPNPAPNHAPNHAHQVNTWYAASPPALHRQTSLAWSTVPCTTRHCYPPFWIPYDFFPASDPWKVNPGINPRYKPQVPIYAIIGTHLLYYAIIFAHISHTDYFPSPVYWVIIFNAHKHTYSTITYPRLYYLYLHIATHWPPHTPLPHLN